VNSKDPCNADGTEDWGTASPFDPTTPDGLGLDNDGDLDYDGDDSDCVGNQAPVADPNGPYSGLVNELITFDGSGSSDLDGTIVTYDWDFGDGATGSGEMTTHTYTEAGTFTVTLTVTDDGTPALTDTATTTATITDVPPVNEPPVADANGPYSAQLGDPITFDGSGSMDPDGTIVAYDWDFGDGNTGTGVSPTHTYASAGTFTVTLTVTDDGTPALTDTATTTATIQEEILADVWLNSVRVPKKKRLTEKRQTVMLEAIAKGDGDVITQDATVCFAEMQAPADGVDVVFTGPQANCDTQAVVPGNGRTTFTVPADIKCKALDGNTYTINWTATIDAPQNEDPTNDELSATTEVKCVQ
jgi:PKD repeat protein